MPNTYEFDPACWRIENSPLPTPVAAALKLALEPSVSSRTSWGIPSSLDSSRAESRTSSPKSAASTGKGVQFSWQQEVGIEPEGSGVVKSDHTSPSSGYESFLPPPGDLGIRQFLENVDTSHPPPPLTASTVLNGGSGGLGKEFERLLPPNFKETPYSRIPKFGPLGNTASIDATIEPPSPVGSELSSRTRPSRSLFDFVDPRDMPGFRDNTGFSSEFRTDFEKNGTECEIDEMDKMRIRSLSTKVKVQERKPRRLPTLEELAHYDQRDPMIQRTTILRQLNDSKDPKVLHFIQQLKKENLLCRFCWKNGETEIVFKSHNLKDKNNKVTCPILYIYVCPMCGATGHNAHTKKYCPLNTSDDVSIPALRTGRTSTGRRRPIVGSSGYGTFLEAPDYYAISKDIWSSQFLMKPDLRVASSDPRLTASYTGPGFTGQPVAPAAYSPARFMQRQLPPLSVSVDAASTVGAMSLQDLFSGLSMHDGNL